MTRGEKLLERMRDNPRDWRIEDVVTVCIAHGVACTPPEKGSHYQLKHESQAEILTVLGPPADQAGLYQGLGAVYRLRHEDRTMKPQDYEVHIRPISKSDGGGFLAEVPELPGCMSDGETPQEALEHAFDAIICWIEAAREMGRPIPSPRQIAA